MRIHGKAGGDARFAHALQQALDAVLAEAQQQDDESEGGGQCSQEARSAPHDQGEADHG